MASLIYDSFPFDTQEGNVVPATDTFYMMLVDATYVPNKKTDTKRSDVTGEVAGAGYAAGGKVVTCAVVNDTATDRTTLSFGAVSWAGSTITARACVIYKHRGGLASADELVAYGDFGANITSTGGTFTATETSPLIFQN